MFLTTRRRSFYSGSMEVLTAFYLFYYFWSQILSEHLSIQVVPNVYLRKITLERREKKECGVAPAFPCTEPKCRYLKKPSLKESIWDAILWKFKNIHPVNCIPTLPSLSQPLSAPPVRLLQKQKTHFVEHLSTCVGDN